METTHQGIEEIMRFPHRTSALLKLGAGALCVSLGVLMPRTASAQNKIAIDLGADLPQGSHNDNGWGIGGRFGHQWNLAVIKLIPEFGFSYHDLTGSADATAWNILAGGRFGIDFGLEPLVFAHAGLGHYATSFGDHTSLAYDFGAALDLTILPVVSFGAHVMESGIAGGNDADPLSWLELGGHVSFNIGE
jgi:hypothetical protein